MLTVIMGVKTQRMKMSHLQDVPVEKTWTATAKGQQKIHGQNQRLQGHPGQNEIQLKPSAEKSRLLEVREEREAGAQTIGEPELEQREVGHLCIQ